MKTKDIVICALLIALSVVLSYVRILNSIALDQVPAVLALLIYKDKKAAYIGFFGHLVTASLTGFMYGIVIHLLIALLMGIMYLISIPIIKINEYLTYVFIYIMNGLVMPLILFISMPFSLEVYLGIVSALSIAIILNVVFSKLIYQLIKKAI